jgi:hypothetical protein
LKATSISSSVVLKVVAKTRLGSGWLEGFQLLTTPAWSMRTPLVLDAELVPDAAGVDELDVEEGLLVPAGLVAVGLAAAEVACAVGAAALGVPESSLSLLQARLRLRPAISAATTNGPSFLIGCSPSPDC